MAISDLVFADVFDIGASDNANTKAFEVMFGAL